MHSFRSDLFFVFCLASFLAGLDLAESCCQELVFESTGSTASGANNHVIGHYEIHSDGPDGRVTYLQTDNKFGDMYLYWYPPLTVI